MKKINNICIIADAYPTEKYPKNPFIEQLVIAFMETGIKCTVINPVSVTNAILHRTELSPKYWTKKTKAGLLEVYSPRYITLSSKKIGGINTNAINLRLFEQACLKVIEEINVDFDAIYGHFIFPSGITATKISKLFNIPSFFAYGENTNYTIDYLGIEKTKKLLDGTKGVIAVSTANKEKLVTQGIINKDKIEIFPNSIDHNLFYNHSKKDMREKYGFPQDAFIIAFVGRFVEIKGANRLSNAIKKLEMENIKSLFIGFGNVGPSCEGVLVEGKQPHERIPELLSAADIFVLPTLAEGCCNSIIEAMACGLPIISSNYSFNDDILDESCSLRIDPLNIDEIANAINVLYENDELRDKLSKGALIKSQSLNINERAKNIINFMESKL